MCCVSLYKHMHFQNTVVTFLQSIKNDVCPPLLKNEPLAFLACFPWLKEEKNCCFEFLNELLVLVNFLCNCGSCLVCTHLGVNPIEHIRVYFCATYIEVSCVSVSSHFPLWWWSPNFRLVGETFAGRLKSINWSQFQNNGYKVEGRCKIVAWEAGPINCWALWHTECIVNLNIHQDVSEYWLGTIAQNLKTGQPSCLHNQLLLNSKT